MNAQITHTEILADRKADRQTLLGVACFMFASLSVDASSDHAEHLREGAGNLLKSWVVQGSSYFVTALCVLAIPFVLSKAPLLRERWKTSLIWHAVAFMSYTTIHIIGMAVLRKGLFKILFDESYVFGLNDMHVWMYELRKDIYAYCLLVFLFHTGRQVLQLKMELSAARTEAKQNHRLTLKSGGRSIFLNVDEVIWAKAASNYVEVHTEAGTHLARMTLSRLKALLDASGGSHVQTHRSYIVRRDCIREIIPTGDGDAKLVLTNGDTLPASRGYRSQLEKSGALVST